MALATCIRQTVARGLAPKLSDGQSRVRRARLVM